MIEFSVAGEPISQGSKRVVPAGGKPGGRPHTIESNEKRLRPWRSVLADAAREQAMFHGIVPAPTPVRLQMEFVLRRPQAVPKGRRGWPTTKPDLDKLIRAVQDSLRAVLYEDDSQVVAYGNTRKVYALDGWTGVRIRLEEVK